MNLTQTLRNYILDQCLNGLAPEGFDDDFNLIDAGIMDSLTILNTVSHMEKTYAIALDGGDIVPEHFMSINALAAFVRTKSRQTGSSGSNHRI